MITFLELLTEKNLIEVAVLAGFFFFGDWMYNLIINGIKGRIRSQLVGFIIALVVIFLIASVPVLLVDVILTNAAPMWGWAVSGFILLMCLIKFYMS